MSGNGEWRRRFGGIIGGMLLDDQACYQALRARDARFDGRFFVGVASTGIYCRPVCGVRLPQRRNCSFFPSPAAAEASGFRPCLRCRPELAPGFAAIDAPGALARRAASLIEQGELNDRSVVALARRLGVSDRHLRRVFAAQFGVSPVQYAQTLRLLLAKRLLTDTALAVIEVAHASGFASLRRFNAAFRQRYRLAPSRLRSRAMAQAPGTGDARAGAAPEGEATLRFELAYRPPLDWEALLAFLAQRAIAGVESVQGRAYRRVVAVASAGRRVTGWVQVTRSRDRDTLVATLSASLAGVVPRTLAAIRRVFDLDSRPDEVSRVLGELAAANPGLRVPGAFDGFEIAVRTIVGQQVSVAAANTIAARLAARFGQPVASPFASLDTAFPHAEALAIRGEGELAAQGLSGARARAVLALARAVCEGSLSLRSDASVEETLAQLAALPGVGPWTAQTIAMRALGWPDAFPASDLGVLRALGVRSTARAEEISQHWRPWRAYAVMHLRAASPGSAGRAPAKAPR